MRGIRARSQGAIGNPDECDHLRTDTVHPPASETDNWAFCTIPLFDAQQPIERALRAQPASSAPITTGDHGFWKARNAEGASRGEGRVSAVYSGLRPWARH